MAEIPGQVDPSEAIEAKLCAYLEGELAPPDRAEIEEYLKNYPQHRQTLSDLATNRTVLRNLPREKAPAEVAEAFQGQMERSMLLDGPVNEDAIVRLKHGPQLALAAAIVVLAAGLGIVVYIILPGPVQKYSVAPPVTVAPAPSLAPAIEAVKPPTPLTPPPPIAAAAPPVKDLDEANKTPVAKQDIAPPANVATLADNQSLNTAHAFQAGADMASPDKTLTDRLTQTPSAGNSTNTLRLVVHTDDPASARKQIQTYFAANNVPYQQMGDAGAAFNGDVSGLSAEAKQPTAMKLLPTSQPIVLANNGAILPSTQPIVQAQIQDRERQLNQNAAQMSIASDNPVFVARSMTRLEAAQLNAVLSTQQVGQTTDLYLPGGSTGGAINLASSPATQPTTAPVATTLPTTQPVAFAIGDSITVTVAQLVGPGVDKTNTVRVADNGTISLPMIEPIPAAGVLPSGLEKQIAGKYKEANLIPDATVTVTQTPTTQPTETAESPATQPAESERVDVVVVVQKNTPTTQPAIPMAAPKSP